MGRCVIIRHVALEGPGLLGPILAERGFDIADIDAPTESIPEDAADCDLLVVLGGPIGAYEGDDYPFLKQELRLLEDRLRRGLPTLGICLGCQLIARALGARVYPSGIKEIGWGGLTLTDAGRASCLAPFDAADSPVLHWHGDTFDLPDGATLLASSDDIAHQAFAWGGSALGLQFHIEVTATDLERWFVGHAAEIAATEGITVADLRRDTARWAPALTQTGTAALRHWLDGLEN